MIALKKARVQRVTISYPTSFSWFLNLIDTFITNTFIVYLLASFYNLL